MRLMYLKPRLKDLTIGSRNAFVRQFRNYTQEDVSEKLGLNGENKGSSMTRYEKGERILISGYNSSNQKIELPITYYNENSIS